MIYLPKLLNFRKNFITITTTIIVFPILILLFLNGCNPSKESKQKENILSKNSVKNSVLLISIDTLRADTLGCYGNPHNTSPNIDRLSKRALQYTSNYSSANLTTPSHMSIFSSLQPPTHGVGIKLKISRAAPMLASILSEKGYATAAFTGGGYLSKSFGFSRGFQEYTETDPLKKDWDFSFINNHIANWLNKQIQKQQPFFCFFHTYRVHDPYLPPSPIHKIFDPDYDGKLISTKSEILNYDKLSYAKRRHLFWKRLDKYSKADIKHLYSLYEGELYYTDIALCRLFKILNSLIKNNKLLIVILSDHGEEFKEHGKLHHKDIYNEILHVPLLIDIPNKDKNIINTKLNSSINVAPTILDFLSLPIPSTFQGQPLLKNSKKLKSPNSIFAFRLLSKINRGALIESGWKNLRNEINGKEELYNIKNDPLEMNNQSQITIRSSLLSKFRTQYQKQLKQDAALRKIIGGPTQANINKRTKMRLRKLGYIVY